MRWWALVLIACFSLRAQAYDRAGQLIARGRAAAAAGDTLSALGYFRDAIAAAPRRDDGYVALGEAYLALGEPSRALEVLLAGSRWTARGEALWLALHTTYTALHDDARALDALRELRRREPESTRGLHALADEAERRGLFLEALAARRSLAALTDDAEQRARVRALELLLGNADLVRARAACTGSSAVERALSRCPL
ncbi:MAG TPA: tetratricopeptide repeat protein [Polyangiales bacterium]|nr:tetratricopeptide repeat protein [Polyangiales bacterium]